MIDGDPLFADQVNNDYHLQYTSPCRDTGDNNAVVGSLDFEGDPRIAWNGTVDMGADEFYHHLYYTGDATPGGKVTVKLVGVPQTSPVGLFYGSEVLENPIQLKCGAFWLQYPWKLMLLSPIPTHGVQAISATLPLDPAPYDLYMQGCVGTMSDSLTHLCVLEVR